MTINLPSSRYVRISGPRLSFWITLGIALILSATRGHADESTLSVRQAVDEGLERSPALAESRSAREEADWGTSLSRSDLLPKIELGGQHVFSAQYPTVPVTLGSLTAAVPIVSPRTSLGAEARWTVWDGLANVRRYQAATRLLEASDNEFARKAFELSRRIELSFFNALAARRFEEVAEANVKTLTENLSQVQLRQQNGVSTKYDVLRVEVQLSDARTELERTRDDVVIQRKRLAQAMGLPEDARPLVGELPEPTRSARVAAVDQPDPSARQDVRAAELRSLAADQQAQADRGFLVPAVGLSADYERYDNTDYPGQAYGGFRDAWSAGVFVRWQILDGGASFAKAGASRARAQRASLAHEEALQTLPADLELWKRRYLYSARHFDAKRQDLKRSEESFRISTLSFQQGRKTITDVLEAETDLFRSRAGVVQSQLDAEEALIELELTIGHGIDSRKDQS